MARAVAVIGLTALLTVLLAGCIQLSPAGSPLPGSSETPVGPLPSGAAVVSQPPNADATKKPRRPRRSPTPPAATTPTDTTAPTATTTGPTDIDPRRRMAPRRRRRHRRSGNVPAVAADRQSAELHLEPSTTRSSTTRSSELRHGQPGRRLHARPVFRWHDIGRHSSMSRTWAAAAPGSLRRHPTCASTCPAAVRCFGCTSSPRAQIRR